MAGATAGRMDKDSSHELSSSVYSGEESLKNVLKFITKRKI